MPVKVTLISNITKVEGGNKSVYAISDEGNLYAWGYNSNGQLGDGTNTTRLQPVQVTNLSGIIDISASTTEQALALKDDGTVWGFGYATLGALTDVGGSIPKQISGIDGNRMKNIASISCGYYGGLAITDDGKVLAWGNNGYGELGDGTNISTSVPVYVKESVDTELNSVFIAQKGKNYSVFAKENGEVWATGYNEYGQLGNSSTVTINIPENISNDLLSVDTLDFTFNNIGQTQKINSKYEFGFNLYDYKNSKEISYSSQDEKIASVDKDGNVMAKSLGKTYIDVVAGNFARRAEVNVLDKDEVSAMDTKAGNKHTVSLKTNGSLFTFGDNTYGQLGIGGMSNENHIEPIKIKNDLGLKFTKIAVGKNHTLAIDQNGNVYSFGANESGQLGNGNNINNGNIGKVECLENIVKISAYENTSFAINKDGELYVWGEGYSLVPTKLNFYCKVIDISGKLILSEYGTVWNITDLNKK